MSCKFDLVLKFRQFGRCKIGFKFLLTHSDNFGRFSDMLRKTSFSEPHNSYPFASAFGYEFI